MEVERLHQGRGHEQAECDGDHLLAGEEQEAEQRQGIIDRQVVFQFPRLLPESCPVDETLGNHHEEREEDVEPEHDPEIDFIEADEGHGGIERKAFVRPHRSLLRKIDGEKSGWRRHAQKEQESQEPHH